MSHSAEPPPSSPLTALKPTYTATALLAVAEADTRRRPPAPATVSVDTQIAMLQSPVFVAARIRGDIARRPPEALGPTILIDSATSFQSRSANSRSRLIALSFSAKSAAEAADIANEIARLYVEDPLLQSVASVDDASDTFLAADRERLRPRSNALSAASPGRPSFHIQSLHERAGVGIARPDCGL